MSTFHTFETESAAREFRATNGAGGWIFVCDETGAAVLFPAHMTPSAVMTHALAPRSGRLI